MKLHHLIATATLLATPAFADHTGDGNPVEIARAAYRAADDAQALSRQANRSCGSQGYQLAASANRLHMAMSDLYYAARRAGGRVTPEDHTGGQFGELFESAESAYYQVQNDLNYYGRGCYGLDSFSQALQYDVSYLEQVIDNRPIR